MGIENASKPTGKNDRIWRGHIVSLCKEYHRCESSGARDIWYWRLVLEVATWALDQCNKRLSTPMLRTWHYQKELKRDRP